MDNSSRNIPGVFQFRKFNVRNSASALKVGTDAVLLGAAMTISETDRKMLDIGTGTGVIALMAAQRSEGAQIDAVEIDAPSAEEAGFNFEASPWAERLAVHAVPLQEYLPSSDYDLIFSNPPFYDLSLKNPDARLSNARHTESLSYREIIAFAAEHLNAQGRLSLILPSETQTVLCRTAASFGLYPFRIIHIRTSANKQPRRMIAEFSRVREEVRYEELTLQNGPDRTPEYNSLTKEFYL